MVDEVERHGVKVVLAAYVKAEATLFLDTIDGIINQSAATRPKIARAIVPPEREHSVPANYGDAEVSLVGLRELLPQDIPTLGARRKMQLDAEAAQGPVPDGAREHPAHFPGGRASGPQQPDVRRGSAIGPLRHEWKA